ncbi:hypothetical protein BJ684DRAFT_21038 [Piptocephalis cylindrospora]|uniref:Uncharacterized protein n=1 Tax=Piptocephalis cylindrospora TaxID=1907219 RepID=A0A4P9Y3N3_9FUNG|nr:hypothetical protein BJ684DRAFT_21038 [Piptocephalis cylindrospora]|eukprot:RKP12420.1 hypothetical protein BJ684DRAFT_21038 [Piptocephalis cylindrospora]
MAQQRLHYLWDWLVAESRAVCSSLTDSCGLCHSGSRSPPEDDLLRDVGRQSESNGGLDETATLLGHALSPANGIGPGYGTQDASALDQHDLDTLHEIVRRAENNVIHISAGMEGIEPIQGQEASHRVEEYQAALVDCKGLSRSLRSVRIIPSAPGRDTLALLGKARIDHAMEGWTRKVVLQAEKALEDVHVQDVGSLVVTFDLSMPEDAY